MEFLQRHLPRVYQAVQNALDYITNVTAQIFGAPPNAPQPRNTQAKTPLRSDEAPAPAIQEGTCETQGADHMTLVSSEDAALEATEESMKIYWMQQDVENQAQETEVRHRKENVDRRLLDLQHTTNDSNDTFSHHQVTKKKHKDQSHKIVSTPQIPGKPEDIDDITCSVMREVLHAEVHAVINEEVEKVNQETLVYEEHKKVKTEEESSTLRHEDLLRDLEPKRFQEHEVPPTGNHIVKGNLNLETEENSFSVSKINISSSLEKTIIIQEISEEASIYHVRTSEKDDQESPGDVPASPSIMEHGDMDEPDIKTQHKKLITPASEADRSPCDQGEEARKTWEHLHETAVRLALHCDLLQDDDQEFQILESEEISKTSHVDEIHTSRLDDQGDREEHQEEISHDPKEVEELNLEEKEQSEEVSSLSKSEEETQCDEQDQIVEKMRKRVHFSPSTEEREQIFNLTYEDTACIMFDLIQEGALEPTTEYIDHLQPNNEEDDLGFISSNQDTRPPMMDTTNEEDQVNPLHVGQTIWYDELTKMTKDEETCESIGDTICQSVSLGFQPEEMPEVTDVPTIEEMQNTEEEPTKNAVPILGDITLLGVDCEVEYNIGESIQSFDKIDGSLEKSPKDVSDHWNQDGSIFTEHEETSVSFEVVSQSSEEIKVNLLPNEDKAPLKQQVHGEDDSENIDGKVEVLGLWCHSSVEETEVSAKDGLSSMTDEFILQESISRVQGDPNRPSDTTIVDEVYKQTSVQELQLSTYEQLQGTIHDPSPQIISIESERSLSRDTAHIDKVQTGEDLDDNEETIGLNLSVITDTKKEEGTTTEEYEVVEELEGICRHPVTGFDLLSEIQSVASTGASEQNISVLMSRSEVTHSVVLSGNKEMESIEDDFPAESNVHTDSVVKDLDLQCMLIPGLPDDKISKHLAEEKQMSVAPYEASGDQSLDRVKELEIPLETGSLGEEHIEENLDQKCDIDNISKLQDGDDLLSELHSLMSMDHPAEVIETMSTINVGESDKGMEDMGHSKEETIAEILPEKITVEEHENFEECSPGLHLSEEPKPLREPMQTFKEEHYSSIGTAVIESEIEFYDGSLDINTTSLEILNNMEEEDTQAEEDQFSVAVDETSNEHLGYQCQDSVKELEVLLDTGLLAEYNSREIKESISNLNSGTFERGSDLLSNMDPSTEVIKIVPTVNEDVSGIEVGNVDHSSDVAKIDNLSETVIVEKQEDPVEDHPNVGLSEQPGLIIDPDHEEHLNSSINIIKTQVEAPDLDNDFKKTNNDPATETYLDLIPDPIVEISESKEEESQSSKEVNEESGSQFENLEVDDHKFPLETGSLAEDIDVSLGSISEFSQGDVDFPLEIQSVEMADHPTDIISLVVTPGEEDIIDTGKACDILDESAIQTDIFPDTITPDEQEKIQNNVSATSYSEELGPSLEPNQELKENKYNSSSPVSNEESQIVLNIVKTSEESVNVLLEECNEMDLLSEVQSVITTDYSVEAPTNLSSVKLVTSDEDAGEDILPKSITTDEKEGSEETTQELCPSQPSEEQGKAPHEQDSSLATLTTDSQVIDDITGCDIDKSLKTTDYFGSSDLKNRQLPSMDHTKQEKMGRGDEEQFSNEALCSGQKSHVIAIQAAEPSKSLEPPTHMETSEDQDRALQHHKGTLKEPSIEEEDDVDNSLLPHNTLDVTAQKSRVQLRRKTSIRRRQGQRQVTSESEPIEPPQPVIRPRPTGVAIFPGTMPIFAMAPVMTLDKSHVAEEQKVEKPVEEELIVKPKKGIPKHAGFGIPHPQMMQELQARMKKKKPNE